MERAIKAVGLGKRYRLGSPVQHRATVAEAVADFAACGRWLKSSSRLPTARRAANEFWAIKDVEFEIPAGEVVGIVGRNGAGKSTLLKVLSRITQPTCGEVEVRGRLASLLEVGVGFHPDLTGRENVYLNGAILGMGRREIQQKFDDIVAFAEIERFLDTPVKRYSSGMYTRLAFAVAAHLEPEILVIDEVLAVGDWAFQKKCLGKMGEVARSGRTVLFVSHNLAAVGQLCDRALWLDQGKVILDGPTADVVPAYLLRGYHSDGRWDRPTDDEPPCDVYFKSISVCQGAERNRPVVRFDDCFWIEIGYHLAVPVRDLSIIMRITDGFGTVIFTSWDTDATDWRGRTRGPGLLSSNCEIPANLLRPGRYQVTIGACINDTVLPDFHENVLGFEVSPMGYSLNAGRIGAVSPLLQWDVAACV